jgi:hypothetical protein
MVSKTPDMLVELKALVIQLDEEHMGADRHDNQMTTNCTPTTDLNEPACHVVTSVKAKVARVGTSLSTDDRARYLREGCCFGCGKTGHRRPIVPMGNRVRTLPPLNWHFPSLSSLRNSQKTRMSNGACHAHRRDNLE